ncbi:hypothetical protein KA005_64355 [bacterium]|nr:hypothetical protein [bacterium]
MKDLKIDYRIINCPDGLEAFHGEKAADAIIISCDDIIQGGDPDPENLDAFNPRIDLVLREDDERWERIDDIRAQGERSH